MRFELNVQRVLSAIACHASQTPRLTEPSRFPDYTAYSRIVASFIQSVG
jgi:hypothetical protein